jgi:hypothetical protein
MEKKQSKRCIHLLTEGTCSLCNGIPRSAEYETRGLDPISGASLRNKIPFRLLPYWSFDFEGRNTEDDAQEAAGSLL